MDAGTGKLVLGYANVSGMEKEFAFHQLTSLGGGGDAFEDLIVVFVLPAA